LSLRYREVVAMTKSTSVGDGKGSMGLGGARTLGVLRLRLRMTPLLAKVAKWAKVANAGGWRGRGAGERGRWKRFANTGGAERLRATRCGELRLPRCTAGINAVQEATP
jgi:hypothetical protein